MSSSAPVTLAVVDLGSNSFRLEVGRVEGDQIFRLDTWRETIRLGAGLDAKGRLTPRAQREALACLARFAERLRGLHPSAVRVVATNTFRTATNANRFLPKAEAALGFPIDVIAGQEEARFIWLGVSHVLPASEASRLVIDIGGGSTEFIVGRGLEPQRLESLRLGCVSMSQRFFAKGRLTAAAFRAAETHARAEIEAIATEFGPANWQEAYASSGTALALADILETNGLSAGGITPDGLARLRKRMIAAGSLDRLKLEGLKPPRVPVLAGGFAVMAAAVAELRVGRINPVGGALRLGVLYDLLGRSIDRDSRVVTVERFLERHRIHREHALRVATLAQALYRQAAARPDPAAAQRVAWAGLLHEIGLTVSHDGFSAREQSRLAVLVLGCRGGLGKVLPALGDPDMRAQILALRLAVLLHHARGPVASPGIRLAPGRAIHVQIPPRWLRAHPLSGHLLAKERAEWAAAGHPWRSG